MAKLVRIKKSKFPPERKLKKLTTEKRASYLRAWWRTDKQLTHVKQET